MPGVAVDVSAVGAVGDEAVGVVLAVDAVVIVGVTAVDAAGSAVDVVAVVVDVSAAAELQIFPGDAAFVAAQPVNRSDCL